MRRSYAIDAGQHAERSVLLDWLDACPKFQRIEQGGEVGDVFCFQFGRCVHHLGVCIPSLQQEAKQPRFKVACSPNY